MMSYIHMEISRIFHFHFYSNNFIISLYIFFDGAQGCFSFFFLPISYISSSCHASAG